MIKDEYKPTFTLKNLKKDLGTITTAAKDFGAILPIAKEFVTNSRYGFQPGSQDILLVIKGVLFVQRILLPLKVDALVVKLSLGHDLEAKSEFSLE